MEPILENRIYLSRVGEFVQTNCRRYSDKRYGATYYVECVEITLNGDGTVKNENYQYNVWGDGKYAGKRSAIEAPGDRDLVSLHSSPRNVHLQLSLFD